MLEEDMDVTDIPFTQKTRAHRTLPTSSLDSSCGENPSVSRPLCARDPFVAHNSRSGISGLSRDAMGCAARCQTNARREKM